MSGENAGTLRELATHEIVEPRGARMAVGVVAFVVATTFGAYVAVPLPALTPVPMTLQPLFVILAGAMLGPRGGATAMAIYVAAGAAGAPVFSSGHAGLLWLMGPTGGYLLAYPAAAVAVGFIAGGPGALFRSGDAPGRMRLLAALAAGMVVIYAGGISQLWILTRQELGALLAQGATPFLVGDVTKILIAFVVTAGVRRARTEAHSETP